jgi:pimeloyl-ACP methyl ester carboxylesterase
MANPDLPDTASIGDIHDLQANGLRFAYLEAGRGPLVLLLHGFPDTARSWDHARARLAAAGYRAVSPWLRGYAPSEIPGRDTDLETLARDAIALIAALGEPSAIVVGHDWGAAAGYAAAALEPARVTKLVAIGIPHPATLRPTPAKLWGARHFVAYKLPGAAHRFARRDFAALPALYRRWSPTWSPPAEEFAAVRAAFSNPASLDAALGYYRALRFRPPAFTRHRITVPTVAFAGLHDPIVGLDDYLRASPMFTGGYTVESIPGGHFMHREHPDVFLAKLLPHL